MFCKKGHKDIAKQSISKDQSTEEAGKISTALHCHSFNLYNCFYIEVNSNLSVDYCIPGNVILALIKLNSYIFLFEKFQLFHYCYTAILN